MITQRPELARAVWRVSTYSGNSGNCVEVADLPNGDLAVRDSKDPAGPMLILTRAEWQAFLRDLPSGD
ncbi:MAG: DUF397 domain-containing protein [Pseudonocardiaceae bacterium]